MHSFFSLTLQSITWLILCLNWIQSRFYGRQNEFYLQNHDRREKAGYDLNSLCLYLYSNVKKRFSLFETYQRFYSPVSQKLALCTVLPMILCNKGGMSIFLSLRSCIFTSVKSVCIASTIHQSVGFRLFGQKKILAMVNYWHKLHVMCHTTSHCWLLQHLNKIIFFLYL